MKIEAVKQAITGLPITPFLLTKLREIALINSIHYSTKIEGNRLTMEQVQEVITENKSFPGRARDEDEVKGYYVATDAMEKYVAKKVHITQDIIKMLHALIMGRGKKRVKPTPYRDGQNVILEGVTKKIVYMPPEAKDVFDLMQQLVTWINRSDYPSPIIAGIAHYQFVTIHSYYDGNGRTARILASLILHLGGYDLKGIYSLDQYYAKNLSAYYDALTIGPSHNYYLGCADADITSWIEYFCRGMATAFENVKKRAEDGASVGFKDKSEILRTLDTKKRRVLELFIKHETVTSAQIAQLFDFKPRTARHLCQKWSDQGFIYAVDTSRKGRRYKLSKPFVSLLKS